MLQSISKSVELLKNITCKTQTEPPEAFTTPDLEDWRTDLLRELLTPPPVQRLLTAISAVRRVSFPPAIKYSPLEMQIREQFHSLRDSFSPVESCTYYFLFS